MGGFIEAVKAVLMFRPKSETGFDASRFSWTYAAIGIAFVALLQAASLTVAFIGEPGVTAGVIADLSLVAALALAVPFVLVTATAVLTRRQDRLPAALLFVAVYLALMQIALYLLSFFLPASGSTITVVMALTCYLSAKNVLGLPTGKALLVGAAVAIASFSTGFLLLALPTGQAMLAAG